MALLRPPLARLRPRPRRTAAAATPLVKVCGVTSPADGALAAAAGADFVGVIMHAPARRGVSPAVAADIAAAARAAAGRTGAPPVVVGVFVDGPASTIAAAADAATLDAVQLHGDGARAALGELVGAGRSVVYVLAVDAHGAPLTPLPSTAPDWVLLDGAVGGSGEGYDWGGVEPPAGVAVKGWLLAGGLSPASVGAALAALAPDGVDVSSGVCGPDGLAKDPAKVAAFVRAAKGGEGGTA